MSSTMGNAITPVVARSSIAGEWVEGAGRDFVSLNPARPDEVVANGHYVGEDAVVEAMDTAAEAFAAWRKVPIHARAALLVRVAEVLDSRRDELAVELTREQGKTLTDSKNEVQRAADTFRYNATLANAPTGSTFASLRETEHIWAIRKPLGVVSMITPWNIPMGIPAWKLAPALLAGNTVVWKPASIVPLVSIRLMEALIEAGIPEGVCNLVLATSRDTGPLLSHPAVRACTFTGSTSVGKHLIAEGARHGVKVQAEMGGMNSAVVLADADFDWAVKSVVSSAMLQTGQRCTATGRALVARPIYDRFVEAVVQQSDALVVGNGLESGTDLGPSASADARNQITGALSAATNRGASVLTRAGQGTGDGYFVRPAVLAGVRTDDPVFLDEVFGPVLSIVPVDSAEEGVALANAGPYGLSGAVFTNDIRTILGTIDEFEVGMLHINSETCGGDPHVPFGGVKDSGTSYREMGEAALDFFTETKTVYLRPSPEIQR
ncbi:MAG: aldehyde dehydrogenase family protein [Actinomycetota bacterium]|nr:aldehyde dehydrogenase family protein [Actinomycetota bacterium]